MNTSMDSLRPGRLAFVQAGWHAELLDGARNAFIERLAELGVPSNHIDCYNVPGAFEIPLFTRRLAQSGHYAAVTGAAFVVDGGIYRHEFVAQTVIDGLMRVQLETDVPVFSMVLTPHHFREQGESLEFFARHLAIKGGEVAGACAGMLTALDALVPQA
ncbi:riboflavin synthase subunit beta [Ralstonia solanacearum]|nr:6,7-dimethyl-8-ribityllumazine synthase [Ralstonia pseudosolanacearum]AXW47150.1 riboflavin synthase subunit beta [Ralstonia solanacearum]